MAAAVSVLEKFAPVKGMCCEISGLVSAPGHNGRRCTLVSLDNGRWTVRLDDSERFWGVNGQQLSLKPGNLSAAPPKPLAKGTRCAISGLVSAPHHNGSRCTLVSLANGRWTVCLEDGNGTEISLKPVNLSEVPRRRVKRPKKTAAEHGGSGHDGHAGDPAKKAAAAAAEQGGSGNGGHAGDAAKKTAEEEAAEGAGIRASGPDPGRQARKTAAEGRQPQKARKTAAASSKGGAKKRQRAATDDDSFVVSDSAELEYETGSEMSDGVPEAGSYADSELRGYKIDREEDKDTHSGAFAGDAFTGDAAASLEESEQSGVT
ncbi:hypothetical protein T484DRAFT_1741168 [Baffinella frigidus]|nr:hypothetical protein T484DRAFT_1741168 [Cryptophyta sp. CCMP2293]